MHYLFLREGDEATARALVEGCSGSSSPLRPSKASLEVSSALKALLLPSEGGAVTANESLEVSAGLRTDDGLFDIDVAVVIPSDQGEQNTPVSQAIPPGETGTRVAVMIDGPALSLRLMGE